MVYILCIQVKILVEEFELDEYKNLIAKYPLSRNNVKKVILSHLNREFYLRQKRIFKGHSFPKSVIIQAVYFKFRFGLSYRDIEDLLCIRGVNLIILLYTVGFLSLFLY